MIPLLRSACISSIMTKRFQVEVTVSAGACIFGCLLILLVPAGLIISFFLAAIIHETGHLLALFLFRVPVYGISLRIGGAVIETAAVSVKEELACAAAGPLGSFLCLLFLHRFPVFALCALIQGVFNLLPVYPMDGGRMLRCICLLFCPRHAASICNMVGRSVIAAFPALCMFLFLHTSEHLFLFLAFYFLLQTCHKIKISCKEY